LDRLVLATGNAGKARELSILLAPLALRIESLRDHPTLRLPEESGSSYLENARIKAYAVCRTVGVPALGDDSGLEVDALAGQPGVHSARYAGATATDQANVEKLLDALRGVPPERRTARFRCVLVLSAPGWAEISVEGICEGRIADGPRGERGFGYDPVFEPAEETRTFAELSDERKHLVSHRGRAARALIQSVELRSRG